MFHMHLMQSLFHDCRFNLMNLIHNHCQCCLKWETHLCPEICKKIKVTVEESRCLTIGCFDGEYFVVVHHQSNSINLCDQTCSYHHWEVYKLSSKHVCEPIIKTYTNVHHFIEVYHIVELYKAIYESLIFPVLAHDKMLDESRQLHIRLPIERKGLVYWASGGLSWNPFTYVKYNIVIFTKPVIKGPHVVK